MNININNITREMPDARLSCLRYQVGRQERRLEQEPVYVNNKLVGHRTGTALVPVFRLLGFGSTLRAAFRMASRFTS
jgi:hypothetical protein